LSQNPPTLIAFDLIQLAGKDLRKPSALVKRALSRAEIQRNYRLTRPIEAGRQRPG